MEIGKLAFVEHPRYRCVKRAAAWPKEVFVVLCAYVMPDLIVINDIFRIIVWDADTKLHVVSNTIQIDWKPTAEFPPTRYCFWWGSFLSIYKEWTYGIESNNNSTKEVSAYRQGCRRFLGPEPYSYRHSTSPAFFRSWLQKSGAKISGAQRVIGQR